MFTILVYISLQVPSVGAPHSTVDSVLASHLAALGLNLCRDIFSFLLNLLVDTIGDRIHLVLKARDFANAVQRRPKPSTTQKNFLMYVCFTSVDF